MMKKFRSLLVVGCFIFIICLCGCGKSAENKPADVETLLQGEWETQTEFEAGTSGEIFVFEDGTATYYTYWGTRDDIDKEVVGTYEILESESKIKTTLNDYDSYLDYEIVDDELKLSFTADSGADAGQPRIYEKVK